MVKTLYTWLRIRRSIAGTQLDASFLASFHWVESVMQISGGEK